MLTDYPYNMLLVTRSHHSVKRAIKALLESRKCFDELHSVGTEGFSRFMDIFAFNSRTNLTYILKPRIRYKFNNSEQELSRKVSRKIQGEKLLCKGLMVWIPGDRTVLLATSNFLLEIGADNAFISKLTEEVLIDSLGIIIHHVYT